MKFVQEWNLHHPLTIRRGREVMVMIILYVTKHICKSENSVIGDNNSNNIFTIKVNSNDKNKITILYKTKKEKGFYNKNSGNK